MDEIKDFAEKHPVGTGVIVFGVGLLLLYLLGYLGGGSKSAPSTSGASAFYQAEAAQAASGNALQAAQTQANAAVAINQQNTQAYTQAQKAWAGVSAQQSTDAAAVASQQSNNQVINTYLTSKLAAAQQAAGQQPYLQTSSGVNVHTGAAYSGPGGVFTGQTNANTPFGTSMGTYTPNQLAGMGFSQSEIAAMSQGFTNNVTHTFGAPVGG